MISEIVYKLECKEEIITAAAVTSAGPARAEHVQFEIANRVNLRTRTAIKANKLKYSLKLFKSIYNMIERAQTAKFSKR